MSYPINSDRRLFLQNSAMAFTAAQFALVSTFPQWCEASEEQHIEPTVQANSTALAPLKQIDAGVLNVGYAETGAADATAVSIALFRMLGAA